MSVVKNIQAHDGFRPEAERDKAGNLKIGYGFNLDSELSGKSAKRILQILVQECVLWSTEDLPGLWPATDRKKPSRININRLSAVADAHVECYYALGRVDYHRLSKHWDALRNMDYVEAGLELVRSNWFGKEPARVERLANAFIQEAVEKQGVSPASVARKMAAAKKRK